MHYGRNYKGGRFGTLGHARGSELEKYLYVQRQDERKHYRKRVLKDRHFFPSMRSLLFNFFLSFCRGSRRKSESHDRGNEFGS